MAQTLGPRPFTPHIFALLLLASCSACTDGFPGPVRAALGDGHGCVTFATKAYVELIGIGDNCRNASPVCGSDGDIYMHCWFHRDAPIGVCRDYTADPGVSCNDSSLGPGTE